MNSTADHIRPRQVQCQRTRRYLSEVIPLRLAVCPVCDDHEQYKRLSHEDEAWRHVDLATQLCRAEFGVPDDGRQAAVWLGDRPETVFEKHLDHHNVYLGRTADRWQHMYSGAHEAFHRVCGEGKNSSHWADEMLAVLFSLTYLEWIGEAAHAERNRRQLTEQAGCCSLEQMLGVAGGPLPEGLYGRVYVVGEKLREAIGWEALRSLATTRHDDGACDVDRWLDSLGKARPVAAAVLSR
jgi:hypothetical protein